MGSLTCCPKIKAFGKVHKQKESSRGLKQRQREVQGGQEQGQSRPRRDNCGIASVLGSRAPLPGWIYWLHSRWRHSQSWTATQQRLDYHRHVQIQDHEPAQEAEDPRAAKGEELPPARRRRCLDASAAISCLFHVQRRQLVQPCRRTNCAESSTGKEAEEKCSQGRS